MPKEPYFTHRDDSPRTRPQGRSFLFLALALPLAAVAPASAATTPLNCATPGWNEVDYFLSSSRHPVDARDFNWDARYENQIDY